MQDVLFYGDWRETRRSDLSPEESPAHCVMSTPARQCWLLSISLNSSSIIYILFDIFNIANIIFMIGI